MLIVGSSYVLAANIFLHFSCATVYHVNTIMISKNSSFFVLYSTIYTIASISMNTVNQGLDLIIIVTVLAAHIAYEV